MTQDFSNRVGRVEPSATLAVSNKAAALEAEGVDVVDLSVGEPDFPTPEPVVEAGKAALDAGHTGYAPSNGIPALREAIAEKLHGDGLDHEADEVVVTPGAKMALYETFQALVGPGDEVVLLDPSWVSYGPIVELAGAATMRVDTSDNGFRLEPAIRDLQKVVSDATEAIVVNSPNNPTGAVYSETALRAVRDLAVAHDVTVISDEIYGRITYGVETRSLGTFDGMAHRTVTINGFSKAYSMTGWRLGYLAADRALVDQVAKIQSHSVSCATNFVQHAGLAALEAGNDATDAMVDTFERRRNMLVDLLAEKGVNVPTPDGAFYLMLPVPADDETWAMNALEEAHVATVPGSAFGTPGFVRMSYANSDDRIREGVERLAAAGFI